MFARKLNKDLESLRPFQQVLLRSHARQLKETISGGTVRSLTLSPRDLGLKGRVVTVSVAAYERELRPLLAPAVDKLEALVQGPAARQADLSPDKLDAIYLVGGSAKLPLVAAMLAERFPHTKLVVSDKPFSSTAMGAAIHSTEEIRMHDILGRTFGVIRLADHGRKEYFAPIFPAGMPLPEPGAPSHTCTVEYAPIHNIGHLRYLECAGVDSEGRPTEGVRHWSEAVFPYDPTSPVGGSLSAKAIIHRPDLQHSQVRETYSCDKDGVITVNIQRCSDGQALSCEIFRA
jgi:hypothetical protein